MFIFNEHDTPDNLEFVNRQSILNNDLAIARLANAYQLSGKYFTNQQIVDFFQISTQTLERIISENRDELMHNDFTVLKGSSLTKFQEENPEFFATLTNEGRKITNLSVSTVRTILNIAMLLKNSDKAQEVRSKMLDIIVQVMQDKTNGNTKYINQRDADFINQSYREDSERKLFTAALSKFVGMGPYKYALFTNEIYKAIFGEKAQEYKALLDLDKKENLRNTLYSEVLLVIASFEAGIAYELENEFNRRGSKLSQEDVELIISNIKEHPLQRPYLDEARTKMASRDYEFRDVIHQSISKYINPVTKEDYQKFLGDKSVELREQLDKNLEVLKRLSDK